MLIALLLSALVAARESMNRVKCASNLRSIGQFVYLFAADHHGRVPEAQDTPLSGAGAQIPTWMYTKDYFLLVDEYGADQRLFICPSSPLAELGPSAFRYGQGSEMAARAELDNLPDDPRSVTAGDPDLTEYWVETDYVWMGRNIQEVLAPGGFSSDGAPFEVTKLARNTSTGTAVDANPPLMADLAYYDLSGDYHFTHGKHWQIPSFNSTPSFNPWYSGTASAQVGDVRINVLFRDGHVELKPPDDHAYVSANNLSFFR